MKIAIAGTGYVEMCIRDRNGILVPVGDTQAMYEAMRSVLKDPALAAKLSQNAIKVRDEFPLWKIAKRWLEVL